MKPDRVIDEKRGRDWGEGATLASQKPSDHMTLVLGGGSGQRKQLFSRLRVLFQPPRCPTCQPAVLHDGVQRRINIEMNHRSSGSLQHF